MSFMQALQLRGTAKVVWNEGIMAGGSLPEIAKLNEGGSDGELCGPWRRLCSNGAIHLCCFEMRAGGQRARESPKAWQSTI